MGAAIGSKAVHVIQQQQVAEMQDARAGFTEITMKFTEERIGSALMKKRASPSALHGHRIGIGSGALLSAVELITIDPVRCAVLANPLTIFIVPHEATGG